MEKHIINLFYWFACWKVESKAFSCIQEEKDEEEWKETIYHKYFYVEDRGMKMKMIRDFSILMQLCRKRVCIRWDLGIFYGQVGCKLNWPLPQRKSAVIFREYFALNPCSLYPGSCSCGPWLPSTPQFGDFIAYHNFCYTYHAKIFWGLWHILRFAPSKW